MNITLTNTSITQDVKTLAFEKNNGVDVINITVDTNENWQYKIDVKYPDKCCTGESLYNIINLTRNDNVCTVTLTQDMLPFNGKYTMQLRGINGDKVYHSETFDCWVKYSIDPAQAYDPVPSEFYQLEKELFEKADGIVNDAVEKTAETYPLLEALEAGGDTNKSVKTVASNNTIDGDISGSAVFGAGNELTGNYRDWNIVGGYQNQVAANNTLTTGARNITKGHNSTQNGQDNETRTNNGYNIGNKNVTTAPDAQNLGSCLLATSEQQTVVGTTNAPDENAVFIVGNGQTGRSNAMKIDKNGEVVIGGGYVTDYTYPAVNTIMSQNYAKKPTIHGNASGKTLVVSPKLFSAEYSVALYCNQELPQNIATTVLLKNDWKDLSLEDTNNMCVQFFAYCEHEKDVTFVIGAVQDNTNFWSGWRELNVAQKTVHLKANTWTTVFIFANGFEHNTGYVTLGATFAGAEANPDYVYICNVSVDEPAVWRSRQGNAVYATKTKQDVFNVVDYGKVDAVNDYQLRITPANNTGAIRPQFFITDDKGQPYKVSDGTTYRLCFDCAGITANNEMRFWICVDSNTTTNFPYTQTSQKNANVVYEAEQNSNGHYMITFTAPKNGFVRVGFTTYDTLQTFYINNLCLYQRANAFPKIYEYDTGAGSAVLYKVNEIQSFDSQVRWLTENSVFGVGMSIGNIQSINANPYDCIYNDHETPCLCAAISEISPDMKIEEKGIYANIWNYHNFVKNLMSTFNVSYQRWSTDNEGQPMTGTLRVMQDLKIGNTSISEAQLKQLLALLNTNSGANTGKR